MALTVRPARVSDAGGIAAVHVQSWRETYAHLVPAAFLAGLDVGERTARWTRILGDDVTDVLVALDTEGIVGWASASAGRDPLRPAPRELEGIYVVAAAHGSGAGQLLLDSAVGDGPAYLWMADDNARAEAFYRRNGFTRDGGTKEESLGPVVLPVVRLSR